MSCRIIWRTEVGARGTKVVPAAVHTVHEKCTIDRAHRIPVPNVRAAAARSLVSILASEFPNERLFKVFTKLSNTRDTRPFSLHFGRHDRSRHWSDCRLFIWTLRRRLQKIEIFFHFETYLQVVRSFFAYNRRFKIYIDM